MSDEIWKPLRVLAIIDTVGMGGGAEQLLLTLLPVLRDKGHLPEIAALSDYEPHLGPQFQERRIPIHFLHADSPFEFAKSVKRLNTLVRTNKFDVLWSHSRVSSTATRLVSMLNPGPVQVVTIHSKREGRFSDLPLRAQATTLFEKALLGRPRKVAVSQAAADNARQYFGWNGIDVVQNCFDRAALPAPLSPDERSAARAAHGVGPDEFMLVAPARYVPEKGHFILVEALRLFQNAHGWAPKVLCFGHGPLMGRIRQEAEDKSVKLAISGAILQRELFPLISAADGVVLPSVREGFGIAAVEAMALGTPLIVSNVDGLKEITEGRNCALAVPPGDPEALAAAMWDLSQDREAAKLRAANGLEVADQYDPKHIAAKWDAVLSGCVAKARK